MDTASKIQKVLQNKILFGQLMPGERITETQLAKEFQCSRGPVREALKKLEANGFVTIWPNRGAVVTKISSDELSEFYMLVAVLEGKAVEWAVPLLSSADITYLSRINNSLKNLYSNSDNFVEEWLSLNKSFHQFFVDKCGNKKMSWLVDQIRSRIARYRYTSFHAGSLEDYASDHDMIIKAVRRRDSGKAREAMEKHIDRAKKVVIDFLAHYVTV